MVWRCHGGGVVWWCHDPSVLGYETNKIKRVTKESLLLFSRDKLCNKQVIGPFCLNCSCYFHYLRFLWFWLVFLSLVVLF